MPNHQTLTPRRLPDIYTQRNRQERASACNGKGDDIQRDVILRHRNAFTTGNTGMFAAW